MCVHCGTGMTQFVHRDKASHDLWLFPHGRPGYSGVTPEMVAAAKARCEYCTHDERLTVP